MYDEAETTELRVTRVVSPLVLPRLPRQLPPVREREMSPASESRAAGRHANPPPSDEATYIQPAYVTLGLGLV